MATDRGLTLLALARGAIAKRLGETAPPFESAPWLREPGAAFVSLHLRGDLRGCIGTLVAKRSLEADVAANARAAAFHDPRFEPLTRREFQSIEIEVSLLSPLEQIDFESQAHLLTLLRPGRDGLVLEFEGFRATYLPQMWEQMPDPQVFLAHLKQKAGLPAEFWAEGGAISRYSVTHWQEAGVPEGRRHG